MHSFQNFIVRLIPNHPPPLETRIWKLVVRALFTDHKNNRFKKKSIVQNMNISICAPPPPHLTSLLRHC